MTIWDGVTSWARPDSVDDAKNGEFGAGRDAPTRFRRPSDEASPGVTHEWGVVTAFIERADHFALVHEVSRSNAADPEAPPRRSHDQSLANVQGFAEDLGSVS